MVDNSNCSNIDNYRSSDCNDFWIEISHNNRHILFVYACNNINKRKAINMNIIFYTILFIIGIVVGSYWNIEANEIPKELDLKRTHYSKKHNEKFISKLTYALIGGVTSVILASTLKININKLDTSSIIIYLFAMLYVSTLVVIGGIDKNYSKIEKKVLAFGIVSSIVYMVYIYATDFSSIYENFRYLVLYMVLLIIDAFLLRKFAKDSYIINLLILLSIILVYSNFIILTYTLIMASIATLLYIMILKIEQKKNRDKKIKINEIPVGFFITSSSIVVLFMIKIFENYLI